MRKLLLFTVFFVLTISAHAEYRSISRQAINGHVMDDYDTYDIYWGGSFYLKLDVFSNVPNVGSYASTQLKGEDDEVLASVDAIFYNTPTELRYDASPYPYVGGVDTWWWHCQLYTLKEGQYAYALFTLIW